MVRRWKHQPSHSLVLPHADAFVTHAGLGSVCAALVARTPMVCLPLGREQPANAEAVERIGAGVALTADAGPDTIAAGIEQVIGASMPDVTVGTSTLVHALESLVG